MFGTATHFAIHIDDMERAKAFYQSVFNWSYQSYGPADFLQIHTGAPGASAPIGTLQSRKYSVVPAQLNGFEVSICVEDIEQVQSAVEASGGTILMPKTEIPHVGSLIKFQDTEGNLVVAMQYVPAVLEAMKSIS